MIGKDFLNFKSTKHRWKGCLITLHKIKNLCPKWPLNKISTYKTEWEKISEVYKWQNNKS